MDAISFVFGIKAPKLRGGNLLDLVNQNNDEFDWSEQKCFVELFLKTSDESNISFKRTIESNGETNYYYQSKKKSLEKYQQKLKDEKILMKTHNFLVFQV